MTTEKKKLRIPKVEEESPPTEPSTVRKVRSDKLTGDEAKKARQARNARYAKTEKGIEAHRQARTRYYEKQENKEAKRETQRRLDFIRQSIIIHCDACKADYTDKNWHKHEATKKHQKNLAKVQ